MEQEPVTLTGSVESIVYRNESNGWTVFEMDCGDELYTVVGKVFQIAAGDELRVMGEWVNHPSYGRQLRAHTFERRLPATASAMLKYLSSGAIKGLGPVLAKRIVDTFGAQTLEVLENAPEKLTQVKGVSPKKAAAFSEAYRQQFGIRTLMLFLQQYSFTAAQAIRIWKRFGADAVDLIKSNPYILCGSGLYIGFERADAVAAAMGVDKDNPFRIKAGILHVLRHNLYSAGHTYIPLDKLLEIAAPMLDLTPEKAQEGVEGLIEDHELVKEELRGRQAIFLAESYRAESYVAGRLTLMLRLAPPVLGDCAARIDEAESLFNIHYADKQREAIRTVYEKGVVILTGGPGTGKTTTLNAIIRIFEGMGLKVALAAPTGRAAKRMAEVTGREAKTIHRLLEMEYSAEDLPRFARNEKNPLDCDALIVDELSMVDIMLLESLLRALRLNTRLVLVGDSDQLPPVGCGNALRDMIDSGKVPTVALDEIFRQAASSLIILNAHRIVRGEMPELNEREGDFFFMPRYTASQVRNTMVELVKTRLPAAYGFSPMSDIQVLVPGRKGELGVGELNNLLQQALNPPAQGKAERAGIGCILRTGDKVMQIKNNYDIVWRRDNGEYGAGVFNGDVGLLEEVDLQGGILRVRFDDRVAEYTQENLDELELAYAITVHKSQGSEFRAVVMPVFSGPSQLLYRNLLYTAVTRARELVVLIGREETVAAMVGNSRKTRRYTGLCEFLKRGGGVG